MNHNFTKFSFIITLLTLTLFTQCKKKSVAPIENKTVTNEIDAFGWKLIWSDEFDTEGTFDQSKWGFCKRQTSDWNRWLVNDPNLAYQTEGNLILKMVENKTTSDTAKFKTVGVQSADKFSFKYGKLSVRAKFNQGQGSWPAIWLLPQEPAEGGRKWPESGEIDLMEHVSNQTFVHQTIHNKYTITTGYRATGTLPFLINDYNTYTMIWSPTDIHFYVNNEICYSYKKVANAGYDKWPFDNPFYIILNQSGGGAWAGAVNKTALPFQMMVDWVRVYQK